ncbi:MAG TPA: hypothetical protein VLA60_14235 [Nitrospirales bacterium]|nr:hypothetical protein [Nitrospirales bacterium]
MLTLSWPFGFPSRFAESGLGLNSALPSSRNRLYRSATPKAKEKIIQQLWDLIGVKGKSLAQYEGCPQYRSAEDL